MSSIAFAGSIHDAPGSPEIQLAGELSPMTMDTLKRFWPKFFAGSAREWVLQRVAQGQMLGGKFKVNLAAGELAKIEAGADAPDGAIDVDIDFTGLSIAYMDDLPPVLDRRRQIDHQGHRVFRRHSARKARRSLRRGRRLRSATAASTSPTSARTRYKGSSRSRPPARRPPYSRCSTGSGSAI